MTRIADVWAVIPRGTNEPRDWRTAMAQILVVVESDDGQRGYGVGGGGIAGVHVIDPVLREVVVGQDPRDVDSPTTWRATAASASKPASRSPAASTSTRCGATATC